MSIRRERDLFEGFDAFERDCTSPVPRPHAQKRIRATSSRPATHSEGSKTVPKRSGKLQRWVETLDDGIDDEDSEDAPALNQHEPIQVTTARRQRGTNEADDILSDDSDSMSMLEELPRRSRMQSAPRRQSFKTHESVVEDIEDISEDRSQESFSDNWIADLKRKSKGINRSQPAAQTRRGCSVASGSASHSNMLQEDPVHEPSVVDSRERLDKSGHSNWLSALRQQSQKLTRTQPVASSNASRSGTKADGSWNKHIANLIEHCQRHGVTLPEGADGTFSVDDVVFEDGQLLRVLCGDRTTEFVIRCAKQAEIVPGDVVRIAYGSHIAEVRGTSHGCSAQRSYTWKTFVVSNLQRVN